MEKKNVSVELSGLIKISKSAIKSRSKEIVERVLDGDIDAIDVLILAKKGQEAYKQLETDIRPLAEEKDYGKDYIKHGTLIESANIGARWDYSVCNDPTLTSLQNRIKERQKFLQGVKKPTEVDFTDEETGEVTKHIINPPIKSSGRAGLKLTIK